MDEFEFNQLRSDCETILLSFLNFLNNHRNEQILYELQTLIMNTKGNGIKWDIEKVQLVLAILQSKNPSEIQEIRSYLEHSRYGWQEDEYKFSNWCNGRCRKKYLIENTPEMTEEAFSYMDFIFLNKEYGAITTYLFGYCIAALFSSRMKACKLSIPYFLQIACKRNSNVFKLVHEIVHICDINTGLFENCDKYKYIECNKDHHIIYPSETGDKLIETLLYYRDIPIVVDGYENEKLYEILIREVANIPRKTKRLDVKARFNVLPVFITPEIQSQFYNVFSIDLTEMDITDEYIQIIHNYRRCLGTWAFELVNQVKEYFDSWNSVSYSQQTVYAKLIESRNPKKTMPLFYDFDTFEGRLRAKNNSWEKLTSKDVSNIGYLSYFFSYYMKVFKSAIRLTYETPFTYRGIKDKHIPEKLIDQIVEQSTYSLFQLHNVCSPTASENINFEMDSSDKKDTKRIRKNGSVYVKNIVKYYKSYKVNIGISSIRYKDERYVFGIRLLPGTDAKLLSRYAEEVRRLLEVEVFMLDITSSEIKLVVSEKALNKNSLIKILESDQFKESKMEIPYAVGYDILGEIVIVDIAEFPHLLVGGTSGSGKSSALHSLLMSIIYKQPADKVKLLLLDFGSSDLKIFDKVPHMLQPTIRVGEVQKAHVYLLWLQMEMERRLKAKDSLDKRRFDVEFKKWASIVCVIDEFPAFIRQLTTGKYNTNAPGIIADILARARKVKIHLVLAAQNASKGNIKIENTNLAAGMAFRCTNWYDSCAIIGSSEAVNLYGQGTMYFRCSQFEGLKRIQGAYMPTNEIVDTLDNINFAYNYDGKRYDEVICKYNTVPKFKNIENDYKPFSIEEEDEKLLLDIVKWMQDKECISNNQLKHNFEMGYDRANRFLARLEAEGLISAQKKGTKLARIIERDKVEKFLKRYKDIAENELEKDINIDNTQFDRELLQEQNIESIVEVSDTQDAENNSVLAQSQPKAKRHIKIDPKIISENTSRYKNKKKPVQ